MYGQQGLAERKFLIDHLMVNGINRLLFADMPTYQAPREYARAILQYADKVCALIRSSKPFIKTAILYHAESEWRQGETAQKFQKPAAVLCQNQISYDIIPADVFTYPERYDTVMENGLTVNGNVYEALIIPASEKLPAAVVSFIEKAEEKGFPVFNMNEISLPELAGAVLDAITPDIRVEAENRRWLRYSHLTKDGNDYSLLHNEAPHDNIELTVTVKAKDDVLLWEAMSDKLLLPRQERISDTEVSVHLTLRRFEMVILLVSDEKNAEISLAEGKAHKQIWALILPDGKVVSGYALPKPEEYLGYGFYGKLVYKTKLTVNGKTPALLDLGNVSDCCEVFINGVSAGKRFGTPYLFEVAGMLRNGENEIVIEVYTSACSIRTPVKIFGAPLDSLTAVPYQLAEPAGIRGPVRWI